MSPVLVRSTVIRARTSLAPPQTYNAMCQARYTPLVWPHAVRVAEERRDPRGADPCLLALPQRSGHVLVGPVRCRFGAEQCVRRPNSTTSGIGAYTPVRAARGSRRRVGWALFRLLRGLSMAAPQQARVAGYPARFGRPAPGRWSCSYQGYKLIIQRYAQK